MREANIIKREYSGGALRIAFFSDLHIDSTGCDIEKLSNDLMAEKKAGARILINGDLVDGILPKDFKRYSRGGDRGGTDAKLNEIVDLCVAVLLPVADCIDVIGSGNHEESILKYHAFDITRAIIEQIRLRTGHVIRQAGYRGFVKYEMQHTSGGNKRSKTIFMHHGKGGSAPVTKGMIDLARLYTQFGSADILWVGHKHTDITDRSSPSVELSHSGQLVTRDRVAFITPGYHKSIKMEEGPASCIFEDHFYGVNPTGYKAINWHLYKDRMEVIS